MRKKIIAGNWKMNKTVEEAVELANAIKLELGECTEVDVVICPPFTALKSVSDIVSETQVAVGSQNMSSEDEGAYTGEICHTMLKELFGPAFRRIPNTHEIYHNLYDMGDMGLPFVQGQRRGAWGVFVRDRLAVLLSPGDIHCGWADSDFSWYGPKGKPGCQGHHECIRMGVNLATYAMCH